MKKSIAKNKISYPVVIKPTNEGSSIGVVICNNYKKLCKVFTASKKIYKSISSESSSITGKFDDKFKVVIKFPPI